MDINLKQASYYELVFPITVNGEEVDSLNDVKFEIFKGSTSIQDFDLIDGATFNNGQIVVTIDNPDSLELSGSYVYELWIRDILDNDIWVEGGNLTFDKTKVRF